MNTETAWKIARNDFTTLCLQEPQVETQSLTLTSGEKTIITTQYKFALAAMEILLAVKNGYPRLNAKFSSNIEGYKLAINALKTSGLIIEGADAMGWRLQLTKEGHQLAQNITLEKDTYHLQETRLALGSTFRVL